MAVTIKRSGSKQRISGGSYRLNSPVNKMEYRFLKLPTESETECSGVIQCSVVCVECCAADSEPISLQAVCRSCIRRTLRGDAEREYPQLTKPRLKRTYHRKKRAIRSLVIPFLESSDEDGDVLFGHPSRITAVFDLGTSWPGRQPTDIVTASREGG